MTSIAIPFATLSAALRVRQATLRLVGAFALALIIKGGLVWWHWADDVRQRVADATLADRRERLAMHTAPGDSDVALLRARMITARDSFVLAPTRAQAAAVAAAAITEAANTGGVRLGTVDPRVDSVAHVGIRAVVLDSEVRGDFPAVLAFLRELEAGNPLFEIVHVSIAPVTWSPVGNGTVTAHFAVKALTRRAYPFEL